MLAALWNHTGDKVVITTYRVVTVLEVAGNPGVRNQRKAADTNLL